MGGDGGGGVERAEASLGRGGVRYALAFRLNIIRMKKTAAFVGRQ